MIWYSFYFYEKRYYSYSSLLNFERKEKIDLLKEEFRKKADELQKKERNNNINRLDNGKTKYTELFEKYKQKIEEIKRS